MMQDADENDHTDPESQLQMALSVLAEQEELFPVMMSGPKQTSDTTASSSSTTVLTPKEFLEWIHQALLPGTDSNQTIPETSLLLSPWCTELCKISSLLPNLSPFELHSVASEMARMGNDNNTNSVGYPTICLLLCLNALQQSPSPTITRRWKRWQSLVCETIRQFQIHWERTTTESEEEEEDYDPAKDKIPTNTVSLSQLIPTVWMELWCHNVVPACLQVLEALPSEASKVALQCGLVATTTQLATLFCSSNDGDSMEEHFSVLYNTLESIMLVNISRTEDTTENDGRNDKKEEGIMELWMYPWRKHDAEASGKYNTKRNDGDGDGEENENVVDDQWYDDDDDDEKDDGFAQFQHDAIWWASHAQHHEHVVGMNTSYEEIGLAALAVWGWQGRPQVLAPTHAWKLWFPHAKSLLLSSQLWGGGQRIGFVFFDQLLSSTPPSSIAWTLTAAANAGPSSSLPDSPLSIFHLLSNRMLVLNRPDLDAEEQARSKRQTDQMVHWIKTLLYCYQPSCQVSMIQRLINDCPYPGLQAMFLDALRPLILKDENVEVANQLWKYIGSLLERLQTKYMPNRILIDAEDLIDHLEIYIGAIAMLQLYFLVKKSLPGSQNSAGAKMDWVSLLMDCQKVLIQILQQWEIGSSVSPPSCAHRLNLLEESISRILSFIEESINTT